MFVRHSLKFHSYHHSGALVRVDITLERCYQCWSSLAVNFRSVCTGTHYSFPLTVFAHGWWLICIKTWKMTEIWIHFLSWYSSESFSPFSPEWLVEMTSNLLLMKRSPWPSHLELSLKIAMSINQWNRTHNYNTLPYMFVHNFHDSLCFIHTIVLILCLQKSSFVWCEVDIACPKLICHVWSYLSQTVARSSIFLFPYFPCARKSGMEAWITLSQVALFHHYTELCFPGVFV